MRQIIFKKYAKPKKSNCRTDYKHGFEIPTGDAAEVCFAGGVVDPENQTVEHQNLMDSLRTAGRVELRRLFHNLEPPQIEALSGEYDAELLEQGSTVSGAFTSRLFGMHGEWLGKAFCPESDRAGVGYNYFRSRGKVVQKLPMDTCIDLSSMDSGESLLLRYSIRNRGLIRWLVGEIRQVTPNVMLGVGIFGPRVGERDIYRRKIPFLLVGPCREYQHLANDCDPHACDRVHAA